MGNDWFSGADKGDLAYTTRDEVKIHFHLHPEVKIRPTETETTCYLETPSRQVWAFTCDEVNPQVEESVYFAAPSGPRKTSQIVLKLNACGIPDLNWSFQKI